MGKTKAFKQLNRLLKLAIYTEQTQLGVEEMFEREAKFRISRRDLLINSAKFAAAAPLVGLVSNRKTKHVDRSAASSKFGDDPVVIIGAGTAGLTAAYRLTKAGVPCILYEASQRVGGRMFTQRGFNSDKMFVERGGELVDTDHQDLIDLCKELGLKIQSLAETDTSLNKELYYIGGQVYSQKDLLQGFKPLAKALIGDLKKMYGHKYADAGTVTYQTPKKFPKTVEFDKMTLAQYLNDQKNLVDKWVLDLVRVCYVGEYGLEAEQQSSLNLLGQIGTDTTDEVHLLGVSDECKRIEGGNATLPETLAERLSTITPIHFEHVLESIRDRGGKFELTFRSGTKPVVVRATQIISAIPFTVLRSVEGIYDLGLTQHKQKCIKELGYGTNAKLMMGFKKRFWREAELHKSNGLVYSDTDGQEYWETSRGQAGSSGIITSFVGGQSGWMGGSPDAGAIQQRLQSNIESFNRIFKNGAGQHDGNSVFQHWPSYRFTLGSYFCPLPGQTTSLVGVACEPEIGGRFCFAGEHTSIEYPGFMNGAVNSGNRVAQDVLKSRKRASLERFLKEISA